MRYYSFNITFHYCNEHLLCTKCHNDILIYNQSFIFHLIYVKYPQFKYIFNIIFLTWGIKCCHENVTMPKKQKKALMTVKSN